MYPIGTRVIAVTNIVDSNPGEPDQVLNIGDVGFVVGHQQSRWDHCVLFIKDIDPKLPLELQTWSIPKDHIEPKDNDAVVR